MIFMQIVTQKHYIYKSSGTEIAALDRATARTLEKLPDYQYDLFTGRKELPGTANEYQASKKNIEFLVNFVFYGPYQMLCRIGVSN